MSKAFDLIVIGTGSAASFVAYECRAAGLSVAIIDSRPYGGTCQLRGCDPKKVLVGAAEAVDFARRMAAAGVLNSRTELDWSALIRFKQTFVDSVPERVQENFASAGISTFHGHARFTGPTTVTVGKELLEAKYIHIATGAIPRKLGIQGEELLTRSDDFLELPELPRRVLFLGSGYIAFEFAHICATVGAQVVMLEMQQRPLAGFDADLVDILVERSRSMGIQVVFGATVHQVERRGQTFAVLASTAQGDQTFESDLVVHGAGRVPDIEDLNLECAGVIHEVHGISVNEYLQSLSNPAVYAAGDCAASSVPLTPVAAHQSRIVAANITRGNSTKFDYPPIPSVVFTLPPLASVGLHESEFKRRGIEFTKKFARTSAWDSSRRLCEEFSGYKLLIEASTGQILGAHLLGSHAEEVINLFALAMRVKMKAADLEKSIWAYPTSSSDVAYML